MTTEDRIVKWNEDRNITSKPEDVLVVLCIVEELFEYLGVNNSMPKERLKKLVNKYAGYILEEANALGCKASETDKIDALCDINVFADGFIHRSGFDPNKAMNQCLLHIESRKGIMGENGKWQKNPDDLVYEPRYDECRYDG